MTNSVVKESLHADHPQTPQQAFMQRMQDAKAAGDAAPLAGDAAPRDGKAWLHAAHSIKGVSRYLDIPVPLVLPLRDGGVGVEWHECGLNIELRFRYSARAYVLIEDVRGIIPAHQSEDHFFMWSETALRELSERRRKAG